MIGYPVVPMFKSRLGSVVQKPINANPRLKVVFGAAKVNFNAKIICRNPRH